MILDKWLTPRLWQRIHKMSLKQKYSEIGKWFISGTQTQLERVLVPKAGTMLKKRNGPGGVAHAFNPAPRRQSQVDLQV